MRASCSAGAAPKTSAARERRARARTSGREVDARLERDREADGLRHRGQHARAPQRDRNPEHARRHRRAGDSRASSMRPMRQGPAPTARRRPISRRRTLARASIRFAVLPHTVSRSNSRTTCSIAIAEARKRCGPRGAFQNGRTSAPTDAFGLGQRGREIAHRRIDVGLRLRRASFRLSAGRSPSSRATSDRSSSRDPAITAGAIVAGIHTSKRRRSTVP